MPDAAIWTTLGVGGPAVLVVALILLYGMPKFREWRDKDVALDREIQKVATELAKEGPTAVIAELRLIVSKLEAKCEAWQEKHHRCEVEAAETKAMIRERDCDIESLKAENASLRETVAEQQDKINTLQSNMATQGRKVDRIEIDVQKVQENQTNGKN
jgi:predicted RNase H-like nuclease (RuvC/YqgF family)